MSAVVMATGTRPGPTSSHSQPASPASPSHVHSPPPSNMSIIRPLPPPRSPLRPPPQTRKARPLSLGSASALQSHIQGPQAGEPSVPPSPPATVSPRRPSTAHSQTARHSIEDENDEHDVARRRQASMAKLTRTLGEDVPLGLVFPEHSHKRSLTVPVAQSPIPTRPQAHKRALTWGRRPKTPKATSESAFGSQDSITLRSSTDSRGRDGATRIQIPDESSSNIPTPAHGGAPLRPIPSKTSQSSSHPPSSFHSPTNLEAPTSRPPPPPTPPDSPPTSPRVRGKLSRFLPSPLQRTRSIGTLPVTARMDVRVEGMDAENMSDVIDRLRSMKA